MARRNGRSYVVRGETPKRYWEPAQGDVVYIEGTRTKLGKPYQDPGDRDIMFPLHPAVRGTTDMSARNIKAIARVEEGRGTESVGSVAHFSYGHQGNPAAKYRVISSFGGVVVGWHNTLAAARKNAAAQSFQGPLDIWSSMGGQFGQGKVVAHYVDGKASRANPTAANLKVSVVRGGSNYWLLKRKVYSPSYRSWVELPVVNYPSKALASRAGKEWLQSKRETNPTAGVEAIPAFAHKTSWFVSDRGGVLLGSVDAPNTTAARRLANKKWGKVLVHSVTMAPRWWGDKRQNPTGHAGVEAIPTRWTPATISTRGGQVQIRTGGRR